MDASEVFDQVEANEMGAGTPMNFHRIVQFLKHVKYPCVYDAPGYSSLKDSGKGALALPYKILQNLDGEAYLERQPTVRAGTAHSIRNACDLARACSLTFNGNMICMDTSNGYRIFRTFCSQFITGLFNDVWSRFSR